MSDSGEKPKPGKPKGKTQELTILTPGLTKGVINSLKNQGATFFDYDKFAQKTEHLPPNTRVSDVLARLKTGKNKPPNPKK